LPFLQFVTVRNDCNTDPDTFEQFSESDNETEQLYDSDIVTIAGSFERNINNACE